MENLRLLIIGFALTCMLLPFKIVAAAETEAIINSTKINLNSAKLDALEHAFKGIGLKRAEAIIQYREAHGPFKSVQDLAQVKGIGSSFVKRHEEELIKVFSTE